MKEPVRMRARPWRLSIHYAPSAPLALHHRNSTPGNEVKTGRSSMQDHNRHLALCHQVLCDGAHEELGYRALRGQAGSQRPS